MVDPLVARLTASRKEMGLSPRAVAADVGLSHGHLSQIETGVVDPKLSTVRRLAERLDVPI